MSSLSLATHLNLTLHPTFPRHGTFNGTSEESGLCWAPLPVYCTLAKSCCVFSFFLLELQVWHHNPRDGRNNNQQKKTLKYSSSFSKYLLSKFLKTWTRLLSVHARHYNIHTVCAWLSVNGQCALWPNDVFSCSEEHCSRTSPMPLAVQQIWFHGIHWVLHQEFVSRHSCGLEHEEQRGHHTLVHLI